MPRRFHYKTCDHDGHNAEHVHRLNTGGDSGAFLCKTHWATEMKWRKERNKTLSGSAKFPILKWTDYTKRKKK
jgi:hypothetical protein